MMSKKQDSCSESIPKGVGGVAAEQRLPQRVQLEQQLRHGHCSGWRQQWQHLRGAGYLGSGFVKAFTTQTSRLWQPVDLLTSSVHEPATNCCSMMGFPTTTPAQHELLAQWHCIALSKVAAQCHDSIRHTYIITQTTQTSISDCA
jgi:hypothetical protein